MTLIFTLKETPEFVFQHLGDMNLFVRYHPVIYKIEATGSNSWRVFEKLNLGFFTWSFTYPATVEADEKTSSISMKANVLSLVHVHIFFQISSENGITKVGDEITFRSVLPIQFLLQSIFRKQHTQLFANLDKVEI